MVYIKCRNSDPIFTMYVSQIPSLTYELTNLYYTELLRVLDLSICVGSSRREIVRERGREVEIPKVGRDGKYKSSCICPVYAISISTYLTYVSYHTLYVILRSATQM